MSKKIKIDDDLKDLEWLFEETEKQTNLELGDEIDQSLMAKAQELELKETHDPAEAHNLFYAIQRIILSRIPKGTARNLILQQKTLYLNRGKSPNKYGITGSDSRMSPNPPFRIILDKIVYWINNHPNDKGFKLFLSFYELNKAAGYKIQLKGLSKKWVEKLKSKKDDSSKAP